MFIPDFQACMLPMLQIVAGVEEMPLTQMKERLADHFGLTPDARDELLPSGTQRVFDNRVGWARTHLKKAGLVEYPRRGQLRITARGRETLQLSPELINVKFLQRYPEYIEFIQGKKEDGPSSSTTPTKLSDETPEELLETAYQKLRNQLASDLLDSVKSASPAFFERLVIDLLVKMGYGGSRREAGEAMGRSGDEGIDGIIKEDRLGLDIIYLQAKRWTTGTVGRPEIQKFAGTLQGQRARKGIFLTTSAFTNDAREYVSMIESKIILIDGKRLAELMIDHGVGVTTLASYEVKRVDTDYFVEE